MLLRGAMVYKMVHKRGTGSKGGCGSPLTLASEGHRVVRTTAHPLPVSE